MLNVTHSFQCSINFEHNPRAYWCIFLTLAQFWKFSCGRNQGLALATKHEQTFSLHHCCETGDIPTVVSVAQTYESLRRMVQYFPVKQIQHIFCLMCTVLGWTVLLKDQTPRQDVQVSSNEQRHVLVCTVAAGKIIIMDVRQAIFFRNPSTSFLTCCTFITTAPHTSVNWRWILMAKICLARKKKT